MSRPRKRDKHLPRNVYHRHGAYWYVKEGRWTKLGVELPAALAEYARIIRPASGGCDTLLNRTLARCKSEVKPNTFAQYTVACKHLKHALTDFTPAQVNAQHIAGILDDFRDTPNMGNRLLTFARKAFSNGLTWGMNTTNPTYGVERHDEHKRGRYLSDEEFSKLRAACSPPSLLCIVDICYMTAQRIGDILALRPANITETGIVFQPEKTTKKAAGKQILVEMTPELWDAVGRAKALHGNVRGLTLFHGRGGRPLSYRGVRDNYERARIAAGLEDTTLHDIRAKALTDADKEGKNAQALAAHTTKAMTDRYLRDRSIQAVQGPSFGRFQNKAA